MLKCSFTIRDFVGDWCSGSTRDFDSRSIGSIPVSPAKQKHTSDRLAVLGGHQSILLVCFCLVTCSKENDNES